MLGDSDMFDDDVDDDDASDLDSEDSFDEHEASRGTSDCDGVCDPQCAWCLVAHACPDDCAGEECPYETLAEQELDSMRAALKRLPRLILSDEERTTWEAEERSALSGLPMSERSGKDER